MMRLLWFGQLKICWNSSLRIFNGKREFYTNIKAVRIDLQRSVLTDVFRLNLRYTIANRSCFVVQMRLAVNEDPYEQTTRND